MEINANTKYLNRNDFIKNASTQTSMNIFCVPFAGGDKYAYREYAENAPPFLKIITLEYPGRVSRTKEPLLYDIDALVNDLYKQIRNRIHQKDYAIYGHSMGGLIAYLLTRKLIENKYKAPLHLFVTGTSGPSAPSRSEKARHLLPKEEFIQEMKDLDGIPNEVLETEELFTYFEPILRADFQACDNYRHKNNEPLDIPITVITGTEEDMELDDIYLWQKESKSVIDFIQMPGKHFFIFKYPVEIIEIISKKLIVK